VLANRSHPPDAILREIYIRTGDRPFGNIDDVISTAELMEISDRYKRISGYPGGAPATATAAKA
jgi:5-methylphenazine-1-carboxylate 1-monooxygenase